MHVTSELAKGSFATKRNETAEQNRMKAYNDGVMKLLAKNNEAMAANQGKEGKN